MRLKELREISGFDEPNTVITPGRKTTKSVDYNSSLRMRRTIAMAALLALASAVSGGCSRGHRAEHAPEQGAPEHAPPTPDTTPIPALRTPAGLVLGVEGTPAPASTSSAPTPTPVP